jgi:hypothetical protein
MIPKRGYRFSQKIMRKQNDCHPRLTMARRAVASADPNTFAAMVP